MGSELGKIIQKNKAEILLTVKVSDSFQRKDSIVEVRCSIVEVRCSLVGCAQRIEEIADTMSPFFPPSMLHHPLSEN